MGFRKAVADCIDGVAGFLLGRDMDVAARAERTALAQAVENARRRGVRVEPVELNQA